MRFASIWKPGACVESCVGGARGGDIKILRLARISTMLINIATLSGY